MAENQHITLSLPRGLLRRIEQVAADRGISVSALTAAALTEVADRDRRYVVAQRSALAAMRSAKSLGTKGRRTWTRDELHER